MKIYIVVTTKMDSIGNFLMEEMLDKIEVFTKAEDAVSFYSENPTAKIITRELDI